MNNKGITLIEIIISIVLISIVLIFLFSLLITVNDINYESEVNSTYLINKSLILKNIEEDFDKASNIKIVECTPENPGDYPITELYSGYAKPDQTNYFGSNDKLKKNKCLKFEYTWKDPDKVSDNDKPGILGIYYYKNKGSYVISYIRGNTKATRILPKFENSEYNRKSLEISNSTSEFTTWKHNNNDINPSYLRSGIELTTGFHNIYIPLLGEDGKDYSLNISYYQE